MKNLTLATAGIALASALASTAMAAECSFSGFSVGADIGVSTLDTKTTTYAPVVMGKNPYPSYTSNFAATGVVGGLHVGVSRHFYNRFHFGTEVYGYISSNKKENSLTTPTDVKTQRMNGFGIVLRPGMVFGNALFFLKGGIGSAQFKHSVSAYDSSTGTVYVTGNKKQRVMEIPVGAGVDFLVNEKFMVGLEGTYTFTKERKFGLTYVATGAALPTNAGVKVKANDTKIGLRFGVKI